MKTCFQLGGRRLFETVLSERALRYLFIHSHSGQWLLAIIRFPCTGLTLSLVHVNLGLLRIAVWIQAFFVFVVVFSRHYRRRRPLPSFPTSCRFSAVTIVFSYQVRSHSLAFFITLNPRGV